MSFNIERISFETTGEIAETIYPLHELDSFNGEEIKEHIEDVLPDVKGIIMNFSGITYMHSSGLRELIQILKIVEEANKKLILTYINNDIEKIFIHTNLNKLFIIVADDNEAKQVLSKGVMGL